MPGVIYYRAGPFSCRLVICIGARRPFVRIEDQVGSIGIHRALFMFRSILMFKKRGSWQFPVKQIDLKRHSLISFGQRLNYDPGNSLGQGSKPKSLQTHLRILEHILVITWKPSKLETVN